MKHAKRKKDKKAPNKGAKNNAGKAVRKRANKKHVRTVQRSTNKRTGFKALTAEEKEIYRTFESFIKEDEREERLLKKVPGAKAVKRKGKGHANLFEIHLPQKGIDNKVRSLINADLSNITRYLRRQPIEPIYCWVTLKIKIPNEPKDAFTYEGEKSPYTMVVDTENVRNFSINVLVDYNNRSIDSIHQGTSSGEAGDGKVWNVVMLSIRFIFKRHET